MSSQLSCWFIEFGNAIREETIHGMAFIMLIIIMIFKRSFFGINLLPFTSIIMNKIIHNKNKNQLQKSSQTIAYNYIRWEIFYERSNLIFPENLALFQFQCQMSLEWMELTSCQMEKSERRKKRPYHSFYIHTRFLSHTLLILDVLGNRFSLLVLFEVIGKLCIVFNLITDNL